MPAVRRTQGDGTSYGWIIIVCILIAASVVFGAVYFIKFDDQRTIAQQAQNELREMASERQVRNIGAIVGDKTSRQTYMDKMVEYLDQMAVLTIGGPLEETTAQVKVASANKNVKEALAELAQEPTNIKSLDPNMLGLVGVIRKLKTELDKNIREAADLSEKLAQLHVDFEDYQNETNEKEQELLAEKELYKQKVSDIEQQYAELSELMRKTTGEQVQALMAERDEAAEERRNMRDELLKTQAQLRMTQGRMQRAQEQLATMTGLPEAKPAAFKPDAHVIFMDNGIVHLNIGTDDRVWRGLTFSIYDKGMPIPKNGRGKAEIEVFDVGKNVSAARVLRSERKRPIVAGDIVANLVWDSKQTNVLAVAGDFDLDHDGKIDHDAPHRVKELIEKFGGKVSDAVSVETDFVVLGKPPRTFSQPTMEELEVDPLATQKYQVSLQRRAHYDELQSQANALWVPILNPERFLYFVGYETLAPMAGRL
ncbi:MAG: BRCT domain-containing protein [Planctomycetota bacterium]|jgi:NAD-dependent DNA ligase